MKAFNPENSPADDATEENGKKTAPERSSSCGGLHKNHRSRLTHRYLTEGLSGFEDHVILELLLFHALPRIDTNPLAHRLIDRFGSLWAVFHATEEELCSVKGVGKATAALIRQTREAMLFRLLADCGYDRVNLPLTLAVERHMERSAPGEVAVFSPAAVFDYTPEAPEDLPEGLGALILSDLRDAGIGEFAVVVRFDTAAEAVRVKEELSAHGLRNLYRFDGTVLVEL